MLFPKSEHEKLILGGSKFILGGSKFILGGSKFILGGSKFILGGSRYGTGALSATCAVQSYKCGESWSGYLMMQQVQQLSECWQS